VKSFRAKILEQLIADTQQRVFSRPAKKTEVYDGKDYVYLEGRLHAEHIVLHRKYIEYIEYSPDPRENFAMEKKFYYVDDFLKYIFGADIDVGSLFDTLNHKGEAAFFSGGQQSADFRGYQHNQKLARLTNILMVMSTPKFFFYQLFLRLKVRNKQFFPWLTYTLTFLGYFLILLFLICFFLKIDAFFLIAMALLMFISSSYLKVELADYEYKGNKKISMDLDRMIGVATIVVGFFILLNSFMT
jgi:lipid-A-disaccharide synthase-like uncharacterized protein